MTQAHLFHQPTQVADTSIAVYREVVVPTKETRQRTVLRALQLWSERFTGGGPTSYELFQFMQRLGLATDVNDVRPRATELLRSGRVRKGPKRACRITGHTAYTIEVVA